MSLQFRFLYNLVLVYCNLFVSSSITKEIHICVYTLATDLECVHFHQSLLISVFTCTQLSLSPMFPRHNVNNKKTNNFIFSLQLWYSICRHLQCKGSKNVSKEKKKTNVNIIFVLMHAHEKSAYCDMLCGLPWQPVGYYGSEGVVLQHPCLFQAIKTDLFEGKGASATLLNQRLDKKSPGLVKIFFLYVCVFNAFLSAC